MTNICKNYIDTKHAENRSLKTGAVLRYLLIFLFISFLNVPSRAAGLSNESLNYVITYKWGLIHKDAGEATLSLNRQGNGYKATLVARTKPWADKFYKVRDTLTSTMNADFSPKRYIKINHEKNRYSLDRIDFTKAGGKVSGNAMKVREKDNGQITTEQVIKSDATVAFDMLSVFYYLRTLNFYELINGKTEHVIIFSGFKSETVTIHCLGKERIQLRDKSYKEAYHIRFTFTSGGGKKSSDEMNTWISTDPSHIPLYLVGKLPVGEVRVYYTGN